jgi:hypothetical protein
MWLKRRFLEDCHFRIEENAAVGVGRKRVVQVARKPNIVYPFSAAWYVSV